EQLEAVLAGVPGPRDDRRHAGNAAAADTKGGHGSEVDALHGEHFGGPGALQCQEAHVAAVVNDFPSGSLVLAEPGHVLFPVGRIDDEPPAAGAAIDDQVVDNASIRQTQQVVLCLVESEATKVVGHQTLQELARRGATDLVATHVAHVEQACGGTHRFLLVLHARVLLRHVPSGEVDQTGAGGDVVRIEGGALTGPCLPAYLQPVGCLLPSLGRSPPGPGTPESTH